MHSRYTVHTRSYVLEVVCGGSWLVLDSVHSSHTHQNGHTALHLAASEGHSSVVEALLAKGASIEAVNKVACGVGWRGFTSTTHQAGRKRA